MTSIPIFQAKQRRFAARFWSASGLPALCRRPALHTNSGLITAARTIRTKALASQTHSKTWQAKLCELTLSSFLLKLCAWADR